MKKAIHILAAILLAIPTGAQQPQTSAPLYRVNAKTVNGVAPGYWPTAGSGLTLNLSAGTANCLGTIVNYAAGTLTMTASTTNFVYLNTAASCAPAAKTAAFTSTDIPVATVVTSGSAITLITDDRTIFQAPGSGGGGGGGGSVSWGGILGSISAQADLQTEFGTKAAAPLNSLSVTSAFSITGGQNYDANCSAACTGTLPATITTGFASVIFNKGTANVTITSGGPTYDGVTTLPPGVGMGLYTDGTNYHSSLPTTHYSGCTLTPALTGNTLNCSGGGSSLPLSSYSQGGGMCHLSDSTGPGSGTFAGGTTAILLANYNGLGCTGHEYPGNWYSNASGVTNTGNATIGDVAAIEAYPNENPPDWGAFDYYLQFGIGEAYTCAVTIGFGSYSDCSGGMASGALTALEMWLGTPQHGKLLAVNATQGGSGTWTAYNPSSAGQPPFRSGVAECGTTGATLTFTTMPASGALYLAWIVKSGGTDTATLAIDGVSAGTLSSGVEGAWSTAHESSMWYGERFTLAGATATTHTAVITVTAGNFCPIFAITPNPASWDGMALPNVYQAGLLPAGVSALPDSSTLSAMHSVAQQMQADGLDVQWVDLWAGWPEAYGSTVYGEFQTATYPNGYACTGSAGPHFNNCGDTFNAWTMLQTSGRVPQLGFANSVFGRHGNVVAQTGDYTAQQILNAAATNAANTFSSGPQTFTSGSATNEASIDKGSAGGILTPARAQTLIGAGGGYPSCSVTGTFTVGNKIIISAFIQSGSTASFQDSLSSTWTQVGIATMSGTAHVQVWASSALTGSSDTISFADGNCNGSIVDEWSNLGVFDAATPINASTTTPPSVLNSVATSQAGDLVVAVAASNGSNFFNYYGTTAATPGYSTVQLNTSGGAANSTGRAYQILGSVGSIGASFSNTAPGATWGGLVVAFRAAASSGQVADLHQFEDYLGDVLSRVNAQGQFVPPQYSGSPSNTPTEGALVTDTAAHCTKAYLNGGWGCLGGSFSYPSSGLVASTGSAWRAPTFSDVVALWASGSCTSGYLKYDGTCSNPSGSGTVTTSGSPASGDIAAFSGSTAITTATAAQVNTLIKNLSGCNTATYLYSPQSGTCVAPGGGGGCMSPMVQVLSAASSTITFSAIPSTCNQLTLDITGVADASAFIEFNGDTGSNYAYDGFSNCNGGAVSATAAEYNHGPVGGIIGETSNSLSGYGYPGLMHIEIGGYAGTTFGKAAIGTSSFFSTGCGALAGTYAVQWNGTAAINTVTVGVNGGTTGFLAGTTAILTGK